MNAKLSPNNGQHVLLRKTKNFITISKISKSKIKMSDHIPFEIQAEIMKYLPIKSLIQFRSVSKQWNSFITSSDFIADYHISNTQPPEHLFVTYVDRQSDAKTHVSFVDDDSFPINLSVPVSVTNLGNGSGIIGSSNGLFCVYNVSGYGTAVIWNPTVRKSVDIDLGIVPYNTVIGFGVSPHTLDPMIVKVKFASSLPWKVEVFTISSGVWRSPLCNSLPRESIWLTKNVVDINGFLYFLGYEWIVPQLYLLQFCLIISFDLKTEEFAEIHIPNTLAYKNEDELVVSKLQDSVVIFELCSEGGYRVYNVWMMENDAQRSFSKLYTINPHNASITKAFGSRRSGELLIHVKTYVEEQDGLFVYELYSKRMSGVGISDKKFPFFARSYVETLLLLNH